MSKPTNAVSRRGILAAVGAGASAAALAAGDPNAAVAAPAVVAGAQAGRRFRAYVRSNDGCNIEDVTTGSLDENRVVVRTEACQCCYSITGQALLPGPSADNRILGHGGVGIVEAIGSKVRRVQVGDRVVVANTPYCGQCYTCIRGRPDRCQMLPNAGNPTLPIGTMRGGRMPVVQHNNEGGFGELMIPYEWYCMPIFNDVSPVDLSILGCVGACGLGAAFGIAPIEPASNVAVMGLGPIGLSAVQGARIKGASRIIGIDPIRARRELALKLGATIVLDPNVEGKNLVHKVKELCQTQTTRRFAGGGAHEPDILYNLGPDYVIEAVGGDQFPPKAEPSPDPTGILPLQQAWEMSSAAGHLVTVSVGHKGNFTLPGATWANGAKNHHPGNMNGCSTLRDMQRFARLIETGQYNAKALATTIVPLEKTREAFQAVADRTTIAGVVTFS